MREWFNKQYHTNFFTCVYGLDTGICKVCHCSLCQSLCKKQAECPGRVFFLKKQTLSYEMRLRNDQDDILWWKERKSSTVIYGLLKLWVTAAMLTTHFTDSFNLNNYEFIDGQTVISHYVLYCYLIFCVLPWRSR